MKKTFLLLGWALIGAACQPTHQKETNHPPVSQVATIDTTLPNQATKSSLLPAPSDTALVIPFPEFSLSIHQLQVMNEPGEFKYPQEDSVYLLAEVGETLEGQVLTFHNRQLEELVIQQRYETSVSIANEGPHCDLDEWKHYTSPWQTIQQVAPGYINVTPTLL